MKKTDRGFRIFSEFKDTYDAKVRVIESSLATAPRVWIFCDKPYLKPDGESEVEDSPLHLSPHQARLLISALNKWLEHVKESWGEKYL